jgi:hypothetical protein
VQDAGARAETIAGGEAVRAIQSGPASCAKPCNAVEYIKNALTIVQRKDAEEPQKSHAAG